jgi:pantothenate kinase
VTPEFDVLLARAEGMVSGGRRRMLGIAGAPGAGKSTLARRLVDALDGRAVLVGMDGFHLAKSELERLGRAERKGAPDTFDAAGYVALLCRLRHPEPGVTVYAPRFHREVEESYAAEIAIGPQVRVVVTEGNYLLLGQPPWSAVRPSLDAVWYLRVPDPVRLARLVRRHEQAGRPGAAAREWAYGSDQRNAVLVETTRASADGEVDPGPEPCPEPGPAASRSSPREGPGR